MTVKATCPAGEALGYHNAGEPAVRCRIAHETITARDDPRSLIGYCCGRYGDCPTWREARERDHELRRELEAEGHRRDRVTV